jgi:hypothetical protein
MKYRVRFNKTRGQHNRGTVDHVWRVFDETGKEWLAKHVEFRIPSHGEKEQYSDDWNICCYGKMEIRKETSTIFFLEEDKS